MTVYMMVAEYENATANGTVMGPPLVVQPRVDVSTSAQSAEFNARTRYVLLSFLGGAAHFLDGASPAATTNCPCLAEKQPVVLSVTGGHKVAGLAAS
jgi:hypothetical protein